MLSFYAGTFLVNACFAFIMAAVILARRTHKPAHLVYALLLLLVSWWAGASFVVLRQTEATAVIWWAQCLLYPVCFVHTVMLHFTLAFFDLKVSRRPLVVAYVLSALLAALNARQMFLGAPRPKPPLALYPHGTPWLVLFIAIEVYYVVISLAHFAAQAAKTTEEPQRSRIRYFLLSGLIGWPGAWSNWLLFFDAPPALLGANLTATFYLLASSYLILKHNILGLNVVVKKTALYALLTVFLTATFGVFIIVSEKLLARFIGYSSLVGSLLAGLTIAVVFNPVRHALGVFIDRTIFGKSIAELSVENAQMRQELVRADRMKSLATLAAGTAHEIKNPLTAIRVFAEYLPSRYDEPDFRNEFRDVVIAEVDRVNEILQQLLEFAKPRPPQLKPASLVAVLEETLQLLNRLFTDRRIDIVRRHDDPPPVPIDRQLMKQAVLNLLMNSLQAMPDGGTLTVSTRADAQARVHLVITDTGMGIRPEDLAHVFDPFFSTKEDGTGLGLAIVHGIIQGHGGAIRITSTPGKGTSVHVTLSS